MKKTDVSAAKKIFMEYNGNKYLMAHDGVLNEYRQYCIDYSLEHVWRIELINEKIESISKSSAKDNISPYVCIASLICQTNDMSYGLKLLPLLEEKKKKEELESVLYIVSAFHYIVRAFSKKNLYVKECDKIVNACKRALFWIKQHESFDSEMEKKLKNETEYFA